MISPVQIENIEKTISKETLEEEWKKLPSVPRLRKKLNIGRDLLARALHHYNIRPYKTREQLKRYSHNLDNFKIDSEQKSYFIGFILADGSVRRCPGNKFRFEIGLSQKDKDQLEKIKYFLNSTHPIRMGTQNIASLSILSKDLFEELAKYNIYPNKTLKETCPEQFKLDKHFWRGVIDGDGYVTTHSTRKYPDLGLCGTKEICDSFLHFIKENGIQTKAQPRHRPPFINNHYGISFQGKPAYEIIKLLYENSQYFLTRKKEMADKILNEFVKQ